MIDEQGINAKSGSDFFAKTILFVRYRLGWLLLVFPVVALDEKPNLTTKDTKGERVDGVWCIVYGSLKKRE